MKTKALKICIVILISIILLGNNEVLAIKDPAELIISEHIPGDDELESVGEIILGVITVIGYALSIIILIAMGIKYMMGSVEEKASYKKTMIPYAIGCLLLVAAPMIANVVYDASKPLKTSRVIETYYCEDCMTLYTYCTDRHKHYLTSCYYCTGCEKIVTKTCNYCGATYQEK